MTKQELIQFITWVEAQDITFQKRYKNLFVTRPTVAISDLEELCARYRDNVKFLKMLDATAYLRSFTICWKSKTMKVVVFWNLDDIEQGNVPYDAE